MKNFTRLLCILLIITSIGNKIIAATVITISQVDTFALRTMAAQPVLKININVTGITALQKLVIRTLNQSNTDVDSVAIYYSTTHNRFSLVDYPGEAFLLAKQKIVGDSVVLDGLSHILEAGNNYFWVTMDLAKFSIPSHYLDAKVPANGIKVGGSFYPSTEQSPAGVVYIAEIYFRDNFERKNSSNEPIGWNQEIIPPAPSTLRWKNHYGGYAMVGPHHPIAPKSGNWNVMLQQESPTPDTTILVSGPIDLLTSSSPLMSFYHSQVAWDGANDELRVVYKVGATGSWHQLAQQYFLATPNDWLKREVILPEEATVPNVYIGFKGITKYGWGVCIDSLIIYEKNFISREFKEVVVSQPNQDVIPQGANTSPILRVNIRIKGNTGNILLNSLKVTSNNTSDADIQSGGVKLYYSPDSLFLYPVQVGSGQTFSGGGSVTFSGISRVLETGNNYYWVTYDIKPAPDSYPGHLADAFIKAGDIGLSVGTYPASDASPAGSRKIKQTLFFDDFEGTPQWDTTGGFQIHQPMGLGGGSGRGFPDPTSAYSGTKVLGTDLTINSGNYENGILAANAYKATSPLIDGKYFKNIQLSFYRWLNLENTDSAFIEYKIDNETTWKKIWTSSDVYMDSKWINQSFTSLNFLDRKKFNLRFVLGPTDPYGAFSGWNIDYLFFTADSIPMDAAISRLIYPASNCDLSASEKVRVMVKNTGPRPLVNTPIYLSLNGGQSWVAETIAGPIAVDDSLSYEFTTASNFSKPAIYNIIVKAKHPLDNFPENDSVVKQVIAYPTYNLPYSTGFEQDTSLWFAGGINSSWREGLPGGYYINQPYEGNKCWKTDFSGHHNFNEYSYVESPCFSFTGATIPMMDVMFNHESRNTVDGAILQYSLDKGQTWTYASQDSYPFDWNWYNDTVTTLKHKGWTGRTLDNGGNQVWKHGRQILPSALANQNRVKFRFVFKSDSSTTTTYDGFAFDSLTLHQAPHDAGVVSIDNLSASACQNDIPKFLQVTIKNYGIRNLIAGDIMIVGVKTNSSATVIDTFALTAATAIPVGTSKQMMLHKPVNLATPGSNTAYAFTLIEKDPYYYDSIPNDTAKFSYFAKTNPVIGLPDSFFTARLDTLILKPVFSADYSYSWKHKISTATTPTYAANDTGKYYITVTSISNGCQTKDSVEVKTLVPDVGITQIIAPVTNCSYGSAFQPVVRIYNFGTDIIAKNKYIPVKFMLNTGAITRDSVQLSNALAPKSSYVATLNKTLNLSAAGTYNLWVCTKLLYDDSIRNDTTHVTFDMYAYPIVNLGADRKINAYNTTLDAGPNYGSYQWNDGSTSRYLVIDTVGDYSVTVTDNQGHGCTDRDTVRITLTQHDVGIKRIISPVTSCTLTATTSVSCELMNYGTDTIRTSDVIAMSYRLNSGSYVTQNYSVPTQLLPGGSITFTFTSKVDMHLVTAYNFVVRALTVNDLNAANDSIQEVVHVWGIPIVDLGLGGAFPLLTKTVRPSKFFSSYLWQDNSTDSVYIITRTHKDKDDTYKLTVTDNHGCQNSNTVYIFLAITDVSITSILSPEATSCASVAPKIVGIRVTNTGNLPITDLNKNITVTYKLNNDPEVTETMLKFHGDTGYYRDYNFDQTINLSQTGVNHFKSYISMSGDLDRPNDTLKQTINVVAPPIVDFGSGTDTVRVDLPHTLDAGPGTGYTYLWNTGATTQTIAVINDSMAYQVTVTDANSCSSTNKVYIIVNINDLAVSGFALPGSSCPFAKKQAVGFGIVNAGNLTLTNQPIVIKYRINSGTETTKPVMFTGKPGHTSDTTYYFDGLVDLSQPGLNAFTVSFDYAQDMKPVNNSGNYPVTILSAPIIDFGAPNDTIKATSLPIILNAGSGPGYSYLWSDGDIIQTNIVDAGHSDCWYRVTVTNNLSCTARDSVFVVNATLVHNVSDKATLVVFPNPVRNILYVNLSLKSSDDVVLELVSADGRTVLNRKLKGHNQYIESIDVQTLPKGLYIIRVYQKDWMVTDKVLVQ